MALAEEKDIMAKDSADQALELAALVGSRICHDLINPLGAIGNGVELMEMSGGGGGGAEMALISDSIVSANAKVRFFRLAFGAASAGAEVGRAEIAELLAAAARGGRITYYWAVEGHLPRQEVRAVFLALMCFEASMPRGGDLHVRRDGTAWEITAEGERIVIDPALWEGLRTRVPPEGLIPAKVQFGILPMILRQIGRTLEVTGGGERAVARL